jgi:hypothetical protein
MSNEPAYREAERRFDRYRVLSIGLYAAGAVTWGTGVVLALTKYRSKEPLQLSLSPIGDRGGMVILGWTQ